MKNVLRSLLLLLCCFPTQAQDSPVLLSSQPRGYNYIVNGEGPIRLHPSILPLSINAGDSKHREALELAVEEWNQVGLGQLFEIVEGKADLTVDWSGSKVSEGARAETRIVRSPSLVVPVFLSVKSNVRSKVRLRRVLLHELGHVLGLAHSDNPRDIMYLSEQNSISGLSVRDRQMIKWLYSRAKYTPVLGLTDLEAHGIPAPGPELLGTAEANCPNCGN